MSGLLGGRGLIEPLPIHLFAYTHHISVFCFVFCVNLSPSTKLAKYFAENLNTLAAKKYGPVEFVEYINCLEVSFANPARVIRSIIVTIIFVYTPIVAKRCFITEKHI
jgi:hypothetical protein